MKKDSKDNVFVHIIIPVYLYSLLLHFIWEMLQMPLYVGMSFKELNTWTTCLLATFGDANIVVFIWFAGFLVFRDKWWFRNISIFKVLLITGLGTGITLILEYHAINFGRWIYTPSMPIVPLISIGILPLIQMTILPILTFFIVKIRSNPRDIKKV